MTESLNVSPHTPFATSVQSVTAVTVATRIAELLAAPVTVLDKQGVVLASTTSDPIGRPFAEEDPQRSKLRLPVRLDDDMGEIIVGEGHSDETISPRLAQVLVELVAQQSVAAQPFGPGREPEWKNRFLYDLLHGFLTDEGVIGRESKLLGLDLGLPRAVILIDAADYILQDTDGVTRVDTEVQRRAQVIIGSIVNFFHLPNDTICAYIGEGEVAVLKASDTKSLVNWADRAPAADMGSPSWTNLNALKRAGAALLAHLQTDTGATLSIGIGRYHPGLQGLARSYQDARAALRLGRRFRGQNQVYCVDSLGVAAFVGVPDERTKIELSTYLLSPLNNNPELLQTLSAFFDENCYPSATASRLSIHRNTLSHRLDKITALTGLDPRQFDDAVQIRLALLLRALQAD